LVIDCNLKIYSEKDAMFAFEVKDNFKKLSKANARSRKIRRHKPFSGITCGSKTTIYYVEPP